MRRSPNLPTVISLRLRVTVPKRRQRGRPWLQNSTHCRLPALSSRTGSRCAISRTPATRSRCGLKAAVRYRIHHTTAYEYASEVLHAHHLLHLVPRPAPFQQCLEHTIEIAPATFRRRDEIDAFGNALTRIEFEHPHRRLEVVAQMDVEVHPRPKISSDHSTPWERLCADLT